MKRLIAVPIVVGVLALSAVALANTESWQGAVKSDACGTPFAGCQLAFQVKVKDGKPTQIKDFASASTPNKCDGNVAPASDVQTTKIAVHGHKFSYKDGSGDNMEMISGEFDKHFHKVTGTLHQEVFSQIAGQCDTGVLTFKAKPSK